MYLKHDDATMHISDVALLQTLGIYGPALVYKVVGKKRQASESS